MTDIVLKEISSTLKLSTQYEGMLEKIYSHLPEIERDTENFNKSSSQFKGVTLDITNLTPIDSARHILAVVQRTRQALEEASVSLKKKEIKLKKKQSKKNSLSGYDLELIDVEIMELKNQISNIEASARGAIRKLSFMVSLYDSILEKIGKDFLTEEDYEKDQRRYHVMTAFNQALCAARSRGGLIDEGNHIYLSQLGINGAVAQKEVTALLDAEQQMLNNGMEPNQILIMDWLERCADKFENYSIELIKLRGLIDIDKTSLVQLESKWNLLLMY